MPVELTVGKGLLLLDGLPAVYHSRSRTLIVSDVHLGYEEYMAGLGVYLPRLQLKEAAESIRKALRVVDAKRVVVNGDLKHAYEKLLSQERIETVKLARLAEELGVELVLVRGNHDTFIAPLLKKLGVEVVEDYLDLGGGVVLAHGHKKVDVDFEVLVIGHEHPALQVDVAGARVKLPALLEAPLEDGSTAVVLPALGVYQTGNPVTLSRTQYLSPIIKERALIEEAIVWIVDKEAGTHKLARLREVLGSLAAPPF
ncbi:metallophosphoesterase [Stetteria hydrogenophila]